MKKGLRPSEKKKQYSAWSGTKIFSSRGTLCFKNSVSTTNLNSRLIILRWPIAFTLVNLTWTLRKGEQSSRLKYEQEGK